MRVTRRNALIGAAALFAPFPPGILAAAANAPIETAGLIRLDGNENLYGPSPAARQAILASVGEAPRHADGSIATLTSQLAAHEGVAASQIVIGTGSGAGVCRETRLEGAMGRGGTGALLLQVRTNSK